MFKQRTISGVILVILTIITLYFGGVVTCAVTCAVSLIGGMELLRVYGIHKKILGVTAYLATLFYYAFLYLDRHDLILPLFAVYMLGLLAIYVLAFPTYKDREVMAACFAFLYVSVMLSYVYLIRDMKHGGVLVILIFVSSWGNDTCAYLVGRAIGKHKMSPVLSPKKSVEGLIGGILGAGVLGVLFGLIYNHFMDVSHPVWLFAVIGAVCALPAVIGDLAASAIKRNNEIKDYGTLIPGHGGILDRFDSILFAAPILYYLILYLL